VSAPSGAITGTWTAKLPTAGTWTVSAFVPRGSHATAKDGKLVVHAIDGDHPVMVDQSNNGGHYQPVGTFHVGTTATVSMTSQASKPSFVAWDALRFHLEKADAPVADAGVPDGAGGGGGTAAGAGGGNAATGAGGSGSKLDAGVVLDGGAAGNGAFAGTGGTGAAGEAAPASSGDGGGCSCGTATTEASATLAVSLLGGLGIVMGLRRRRRR
jgi:MYXO-CTERM domain-containing protein